MLEYIVHQVHQVGEGGDQNHGMNHVHKHRNIVSFVIINGDVMENVKDRMDVGVDLNINSTGRDIFTGIYRSK